VGLTYTKPIECELVLIQSTPFCNIDCTYCYLPNRRSTKRIDIDTIKRIAVFLFNSPYIAENLRILWHAGEPLTVPISFYEEALKVINDENFKQIDITHTIQTNGMLINQEWCEFFKRSKIYLGISIDGPNFLHNTRRVDRRGRGTHDRVMAGIELLKKNEITFAVLAVLTQESLKYPQEVWDFFRDNGIFQFGFNFEEIVGINHRTSLSDADAITKTEGFFEHLVVLSESDARVSVRELEFVRHHIKYGTIPRHSKENVPFVILNFDCNGNVSTFSPELLTSSHPEYGNFVFGNVNHDSIEELFSSKKFSRIAAEIEEGVRACEQTCEYFRVCGGGRPAHKLFENGAFNSTETLTCRLDIKAITNVVLAHLERRYTVKPQSVI
jgi:uncharacterized protein